MSDYWRRLRDGLTNEGEGIFFVAVLVVATLLIFAGGYAQRTGSEVEIPVIGDLDIIGSGVAAIGFLFVWPQLLRWFAQGDDPDLPDSGKACLGGLVLRPLCRPCAPRLGLGRGMTGRHDQPLDRTAVWGHRGRAESSTAGVAWQVAEM